MDNKSESPKCKNKIDKTRENHGEKCEGKNTEYAVFKG